jgi:hypothetical protein
VTLGGTSVQGGNSLGGNTVSLNVPAPPSGVTVNLSSSNPGAAQVPATVFVAGGAWSTGFNVTTSAVGSNTAVTISASLGSSSANAGLTVLAPASTAQVSSITLANSSGAGGITRKINTVRLNLPAPAGGAVVLLSSSNPGILAVPASVTIGAGLQETRFAFTPMAASTNTPVMITASYGGASISATYTIVPAQLNLLQLVTNPVRGGSVGTGRLALTGVAHAGGIAVSVSSSSGVASVPTVVTVPAGASTVDFPITTSAVGAPTAVTITVTQGSVVRQGTLTLNP